MKSFLRTVGFVLSFVLTLVVSAVVIFLVAQLHSALGAIVGVAVFAWLLSVFHRRIFQIPFGWNIKNLSHLTLSAFFAYLILGAFLIPDDVPELYKPNLDGIQLKTITLSKGEEMGVFVFDSGAETQSAPILFVPGGPGGPIT